MTGFIVVELTDEARRKGVHVLHDGVVETPAGQLEGLVSAGSFAWKMSRRISTGAVWMVDICGLKLTWTSGESMRI